MPQSDRVRPLWLRRLRQLLAASLVCGPALATAAGFQRVEIAAADGDPALAVMIWTPCAAAGGTTQLGPYLLAAVAGCEIVGDALPLVAISHGQGGSLLGHHNTAVALTEAGFVVISVNHPGDSFGDESAAQSLRIFERRPRDISRAISYMLTDWPQRQRLDPASIGVFGFSRGGYTALALAGAVPSAAAGGARFCAGWLSRVVSPCRQLKGADAAIQVRADPRIKAAVVLDPLNLFDATGLRRVAVPVQLWASELGGDGVELSHVEAVRAALDPSTEYHVARGAGHFVYLAPCPPALRSSAPRICEDPKGFDRVAWHRQMNASVVAFFKRHLAPARRAGGR